MITEEILYPRERNSTPSLDGGFAHVQNPIARSIVSTNHWLRSMETYSFPWRSTLVSANNASHNSGQFASDLKTSCLRLSNLRVSLSLVPSIGYNIICGGFFFFD